MPIYANTRRTVWLTWLVAILWNALTWTAVVKGYDRLLQIFQERPIFLFFVLFPLLGVVIVFSAIRETLVWRKFGRTVLIPSGGGYGVAGYVLMPDVIRKVAPARLSLVCFRRYSYQSSEGSEMRQEAVWQDEKPITPKASGSGLRIDFCFHPPGNISASGEQGQDSYHWELRLHMPLPGINCNLSFELPVTVSMLGGAEAIVYSDDKERAEVTLNTMPAIETVAGGLRFNYPAGRARGTGLVLMLIGLFIGGIVFLTCKSLQPFLVVTVWLFLGTTLLLILILFLMGLYLVFNTLTVEVGAKGLRKEMQIFGYRLTEQVALSDIVDITVQSNGSSSIGNRTRVYYVLQLTCRNRAGMQVGDSIENYSAAQKLRDQMLTALTENSQTSPAATQAMAEFQKSSLPNWLKKLSPFGKLLRYAFIIAALYDFGQWLRTF